jgi:hypothetical protein
MTTSIIELDYNEPNRPYSQRELTYMKEILFKSLRLGENRADHKKCDHFYFVKENGRKEKEMLESKDTDIGNCSVCWKLNKTPRNLKNTANNLVDSYCNEFYDKSVIVTHKNVSMEIAYYKWLYEDFN